MAKTKKKFPVKMLLGTLIAIYADRVAYMIEDGTFLSVEATMARDSLSGAKSEGSIALLYVVWELKRVVAIVGVESKEELDQAPIMEFADVSVDEYKTSQH